MYCFLVFLSCSDNDSKFELCPVETRPYYDPILNYKGGFYEIKKIFFDHYEAVYLPNNNGIVKVIFNINCKGKAGNYTLETYSLNYKNIEINENITSQILKLTKSLEFSL